MGGILYIHGVENIETKGGEKWADEGKKRSRWRSINFCRLLPDVRHIGAKISLKFHKQKVDESLHRLNLLYDKKQFETIVQTSHVSIGLF